MRHHRRTSLWTSRWDDLDAAVRRVAAEHGTGSLVVGGDRESATLYFEDGDIVFALGHGDGIADLIDPSWFETMPAGAIAIEASLDAYGTSSDVSGRFGDIIDDVVRRLRINDSTTIEFTSAVAPIRSRIAFAADEWFDLDETEPFALCPLTRIA